MKSIGLLKFAAATALVLGTWTAQAAKTDPWKAQGFEFSHITEVMDSGLCTRSEDLAIMQCVSLLETAYGLATQATETHVFTRNPENYYHSHVTYEVRQRHDYGAFVSVTVSPDVSIEERRQAIRDTKLMAMNDWMMSVGKDISAQERSAVHSDLAAAWRDLIPALRESAKESSESSVVARLMLSYMSEVDPHAFIVTNQARFDSMKETRRTFVGIGITLASDSATKMVKVREVLADGAAVGKLFPGDLIEAVGEDYETAHKTAHKDMGLTVEEIVGEEGTPVWLWIRRKGELQRVELIRKKIVVQPIKTKLMTSESGRPINYIDINTFNTEVGPFCKEIAEARAALVADQDGFYNVLLDLRANMGGNTQAAGCTLQQFQKHPGESVTFREGLMRADGVETSAYGTAGLQDNSRLRVTVLIDSGSASASEVVSGALQSFDDALVVGMQSVGKGVQQSGNPILLQFFSKLDKYFPFKSAPMSGLMFFRTTDTFFFYGSDGKADSKTGLPSQEKIWTNHLIGVTPDVEINDPFYSEENSYREIDVYLDSSVDIGSTIPAPVDQERTAKAAAVNRCVEEWKKGMSDETALDVVLTTAVEASACAVDVEPDTSLD